MNISEYNNDPRYWAVWQKMQLLDIRDVSTGRQDNNGTIVWKLPIMNINNRNPSYIEVASFSTGYVRNQNSGYSNYQLNKRCASEPEYFQLDNGDYRKFETRGCVLIPIEIDRLEYLISYCLKNYFIKKANEVVEGKYVSQWYHDHMLENANSPTVTRNLKKISELESDVRELESKYQASQSDLDEANSTYGNNVGAMARIQFLEKEVMDITEARDYYLNKTHNLENKLGTINKISE